MEPDTRHRATGANDERGRALHARLLAGEPTASSDLAVEYLPRLVARLHRIFPRLDGDLLEGIADEVIFQVATRPSQFNPDLRSLWGYLTMAAHGDVLNAVKRERNIARHVSPLEDVEVSASARNSMQTGTEDPADVVIAGMDRERLDTLRGHFDATDWELVQVIVDGERRTERYAAVLGIGDRPREEQAREVKRVKDRLRKRLQRLWERMADDD